MGKTLGFILILIGWVVTASSPLGFEIPFLSTSMWSFIGLAIIGLGLFKMSPEKGIPIRA